MTRAFFDGQMKRMFGLKFPPASTDTHWEALSDLPVDVLASAVSRAIRTRIDFPVPLELRQDADQEYRPAPVEPPNAGADLDEPVTVMIPRVNKPIVITREWKLDCDECGDTGWREWWCGARDRFVLASVRDRVCGKRHDESYAHGWAEQCPCKDWNPTIKRRNERNAKYASKPGKAMA